MDLTRAKESAAAHGCNNPDPLLLVLKLLVSDNIIELSNKYKAVYIIHVVYLHFSITFRLADGN